MKCRKCQRNKAQRDSGRWVCRPCESAYQRAAYAKDPARSKEKSRRLMAVARRDPAKRPGILAAQRKAWRNGGSVKRQLWMERLRREDPFRWKALTIHPKVRGALTADNLQRIWERNPGVCALTGRPLNLMDAHLDHIIPRSRGGANSPENLRWVCAEANTAKGNLLDSEFSTLCFQVAEYIGRLIVEADKEMRGAA